VLVFNPYFRIGLQEAIEHPLFSQVRNIEKENIKGAPVTLTFENDDLTKDRLRELILRECSHFRK
jgi:hypothetical protein